MSSGDARVPYRATTGAAAYDQIRPLPACVLLENVRSLYNVGAFFRTADAVALKKYMGAGSFAAFQAGRALAGCNSTAS